jgi:hypothetical protein
MTAVSCRSSSDENRAEKDSERNASGSRATTNGGSIGSGISRDANLVTNSTIDGDDAVTTLSPMGDVDLAAIGGAAVATSSRDAGVSCTAICMRSSCPAMTSERIERIIAGLDSFEAVVSTLRCRGAYFSSGGLVAQG